MFIHLLALLPVLAGAAPTERQVANTTSANPSPNPSASTTPAGNVTTGTLILPAYKPKYAEKLDPNVAAFSIEMDKWTDWAGEEVGKPNTFVNTVMGHLAERTGSGPYLRIGGKSSTVK
jgi:hypothetical protein